MSGLLKFDVYGRVMFAEQIRGRWSLFVAGVDGKRRPVQVVVPDGLRADDIAQYLDDIFHEMATPARPAVVQLRD